MRIKYWLSLVLLTVTLVSAEARLGGGRSFGGRGSRSVGPRSYSAPRPSTPYSNPQYNNYNNYRTTPPPVYPPPSAGGGFLRGLAGGLAGGFLGSMLFRGMGYGSGYAGGYGGGGGLGLLEILLIAGVAFFLFRWFRSQRVTQVASPVSSIPVRDSFYETDNATASAFSSDRSESEIVDVLRKYDGQFDLAQFKESRLDDFFRTQAAFMNRDSQALRDKLTPQMYEAVEGDLNQLKTLGRINRLENITVRDAEVVEAWDEVGKEYVTLRIRANLLDYTIDESTSSVISGSKTDPVKFEEYWTFVKDVGFGSSGGSNWRLSAIENH